MLCWKVILTLNIEILAKIVKIQKNLIFFMLCEMDSTTRINKLTRPWKKIIVSKALKTTESSSDENVNFLKHHKKVEIREKINLIPKKSSRGLRWFQQRRLWNIFSAKSNSNAIMSPCGFFFLLHNLSSLMGLMKIFLLPLSTHPKYKKTLSSSNVAMN
jgi:hypothetical protein